MPHYIRKPAVGQLAARVWAVFFHYARVCGFKKAREFADNHQRILNRNEGKFEFEEISPKNRLSDNFF